MAERGELSRESNPRVTFQRPLELTGCFVRVLLISASQYVSAGGGLYIYGTATLIDTNVYANRAEFGQTNVAVPLIAS